MDSKIVQIADFQSGTFEIPGSSSVNSGVGVNTTLQAFIERMEKELLYKALGKVQGDEFYTALDNIGAAAAHWQALNGGSGEYPGIKEIVQWYIYSNWIRQDEVKYTASGAGISKVKNTTQISMTSLFVDAWNEFVVRYQDMNLDGYKQDSLEGFIQNTPEISDEYFVRFKFENSFGL